MILFVLFNKCENKGAMGAEKTTKWTVYMIETESGKLYTGITSDMNRRFNEHSKRKGARFFSISKPKSIVYQELYPNRSEATKREIAIKKMSRQEKLLLIKVHHERHAPL